MAAPLKGASHATRHTHRHRMRGSATLESATGAPVTRRSYPSLAALNAAVTSGELTGAVHVLVLHDDDCAAPISPCTCSPEFVAEPLTVDAYQRGQRAQAAWLRAARGTGS